MSACAMPRIAKGLPYSWIGLVQHILIVWARSARSVTTASSSLIVGVVWLIGRLEGALGLSFAVATYDTARILSVVEVAVNAWI